MKKIQSAVVPALLIIGVVILVLANAEKRPSASQKNTATAPTAVAAPMPSVFDEKMITDYEAFVKDIRADLEKHMAKLDTTPITDAGLLSRIEEGKRLVEKQADLPDAWQWSQVKAAVRRFGAGIAITTPPTLLAKTTTLLAYENRSNALYVWKDKLLTTSAEDLAAFLVHEATHVVVLDVAMTMTGYTREELSALGVVCEDFSINWKIATEALAFFNQAVWVATHPDNVGETLNAFGGVFVQAVQAKSGAYREYAIGLLDYAKRHRQTEMGQIGVNLQCGMPVIVRGPNRGMSFVPAMMDHEFLGPLIEALSKERRATP